MTAHDWHSTHTGDAVCVICGALITRPGDVRVRLACPGPAEAADEAEPAPDTRLFQALPIPTTDQNGYAHSDAAL